MGGGILLRRSQTPFDNFQNDNLTCYDIPCIEALPSKRRIKPLGIKMKYGYIPHVYQGHMKKSLHLFPSLSLSLSLCFALSPQSLAEVVNGRVVLHFPRVRTHRRLKRLIDRDAQALKSTTNEVLQDRNQITTCQLVFHCHSHSYILTSRSEFL